MTNQVVLGHGIFWGRQQRQRQQIDWIDVGTAVDVDRNLIGQRVDRAGKPIGSIRGAHVFAPIRRALVEKRQQVDRLAEAHRNFAVVFTQQLERAQQAE